jgi:hypothetical protein
LFRQFFADKSSPFSSSRVNGPHGSILPAFTSNPARYPARTRLSPGRPPPPPAPDDKYTKKFSISMQKKPPCTLGGKNVFFQGSTNGNGFSRVSDYQLFFKDLESGLVGHYLVSLSVLDLFRC